MCHEAGILCKAEYTKKSLALPTCCLRELRDIVISHNKFFLKKGIQVGVANGNLFGAIKFHGGSLPWDTNALMQLFVREFCLE